MLKTYFIGSNGQGWWSLNVDCRIPKKGVRQVFYCGLIDSRQYQDYIDLIKNCECSVRVFSEIQDMLAEWAENSHNCGLHLAPMNQWESSLH